jgi:hypothetical protein
MAISRYKKINNVINNDADYKKIFSSRFGVNGLTQTTSTTFRIPTENEINSIQYINETWGLGKRLYKFSYNYYGDSQYWWLIALFNGIATEAEIEFGQVIKIPVPLDIVLNLYGY